MDVYGPPDTLYEGEKYNLSFKFNARYPFDSPIVTFVGDDIPVHPHVYRYIFKYNIRSNKFWTQVF